MNNILWTGGWDSTFRVLSLVILQNKEVQPYYIIDPGRASNEVELMTMEKIRKEVVRKFPNTKGLIKKTIVVNMESIPKNKVISQKFQKLKESSFMGSQYDWLARYSEAKGISSLELSIHQDDKATFFVRQNVAKVVKADDEYYKLRDDLYNTGYDIFKYYHFPLLDFSKKDMEKIAKANNFDSIMEMTWFCFNPTWRKTPCGYCNPCKYTREEGLGRRVPSKFMGMYNRVENAFYYRIKRLFRKMSI
ncbi:7-cyano-7-deazaguanine synthase [Tetragenococcus halophilus]|uniref:7-cyano-7-deazaguanine synthase n=1 Tax=Tetragenococcus halophilus TaxID=51669 RepID=UPI0030C8FFF4